MLMQSPVARGVVRSYIHRIKGLKKALARANNASIAARINADRLGVEAEAVAEDLRRWQVRLDAVMRQRKAFGAPLLDDNGDMVEDRRLRGQNE